MANQDYYFRNDELDIRVRIYPVETGYKIVGQGINFSEGVYNSLFSAQRILFFQVKEKLANMTEKAKGEFHQKEELFNKAEAIKDEGGLVSFLDGLSGPKFD